MGKKKVTDDEIICAINELHRRSNIDWENRFGDPSSAPAMFRREDIQDICQIMFEFEMSSSGFRSRLKNLVAENHLLIFRINDIPFYTIS